MSACKVPLVERLRGIPQNLRAEWAMQWDEEGRATGHTLSPVGQLCHEAADRIAELEADAHGMYAEIMQWRAEVERLRDSLAATGDTRHEAMEAAIRVAEAHSETIRQLRDEVERLRDAIAEADHTDGCAYTRAFREWQRGPQTKHTAPIEAELCDCFVSAIWRGEGE